MPTLAEQIDFVLGVDTHKHSHTAALVTPSGGLVVYLSVSADADGYARLLAFAREHATGRRIWAIEGTGSFGAGLTAHLLEHAEWVVEIDRPKRPARRNRAKTDELDALRAAREALSREHLAQPRRRGDREALRVLLATRKEVVQTRTRAINHLKALVINAPEAMRAELRSFKTGALVVHCATLQTCTAPSSAERAATVLTLQLTARRIQSLEAEAAELEAQIEPLVQALAPRLRAEFGVGPISAAQIICAWSHAGRLRSEAAFAALGGVAPIPASSGQVQRHRLNRSGDRQLNCALHTIVICRLARHAETQAYATRRAAQGKSAREITRCLKRHLARRLFKLLEAGPQDSCPDLELAA
jgi:transposase